MLGWATSGIVRGAWLEGPQEKRVPPAAEAPAVPQAPAYFLRLTAHSPRCGAHRTCTPWEGRRFCCQLLNFFFFFFAQVLRVRQHFHALCLGNLLLCAPILEGSCPRSVILGSFSSLTWMSLRPAPHPGREPSSACRLLLREQGASPTPPWGPS